MNNNETGALTIAEFCKKYRISRSHFYSIRRTAKSPKILKIGVSVRIPISSLSEWETLLHERRPEDCNSPADKPTAKD